MKVLVTGCKGQLGQALAETAPGDATIVGVDLPELDITDAASVLVVIGSEAPAVVVNAAAYTAVDQAEADSELAAAINVDGARNLAVAARETGARLIHISTDFVFDGEATAPYEPDAPANPLSVYGRTKRDSELAVLEELPESSVVVRTSWLYSKTGHNFVKTMLRLMHEKDEISVVADQVGTPTWANSLAGAIWAVIDRPEISGIVHWTDAGRTNWCEFAAAIQEEGIEHGLLEKAIPIHAIGTEDYPTAAVRPKYSVLDTSATSEALGLHPAPWRDNLRRMIQGMTA